MLSLGHILISDLVVTNLFMHSLPGMILLYLATPFLAPKVFCIRYHHFVRSCIATGSELLTYMLHIATLAEVDQKIHQSMCFLPLLYNLH